MLLVFMLSYSALHVHARISAREWYCNHGNGHGNNFTTGKSPRELNVYIISKFVYCANPATFIFNI